PLAEDVSAVMQKRTFRQDLLERRLALEQRLPAQILAIEIKEIERAIEESRRVPLGILQELEARPPLRVERHKLSIEHRLVLDGSKRLADRGIFPRDVETVAGTERDVAGFRHGDGAKAVPFGLEHPIGIVE